MGVPLYACVRELCLVLVLHLGNVHACLSASAGGATAFRLVSIISHCTALTCRAATFDGFSAHACTHPDV